MLMSIGTEVTFSAAHFLPDHPRCGAIHGHTWRVKIEYMGFEMYADADTPLPPNGMLVDFGHIKRLITNEFDHRLLNDVMEIPTAENIAIYIVKLMPEVWGYSYVLNVTVWESKVSYATVSMRFDFERESVK